MELHRGRFRSLEEKEEIISIVSNAVKAGLDLQTACSHLDISKKSYYRWKSNKKIDQRKGPKTVQNKLSPEEEQKIIDCACSSEYRDLPPTQIVPKLLDKEVYLGSESTFYRVLKKNGLAKNRNTTKTRKAKSYTKPVLIATEPNQIWSWDITYLKTNIIGKFYYLYLFLDIYSRFIVAGKVFEVESGELSSELFQEAITNQNIKEKTLTLHSDNGSPMKSICMKATLERLGVLPSNSRPSVSNDNAFSESIFKTMKYIPKFPFKEGFKSLEDANEWVAMFINWYNKEHQHSGIRFCTPMQRHNKEDSLILEKREIVLQKAKAKNPIRWINGKIRNCQKIGEVSINKEKTLVLSA